MVFLTHLPYAPSYYLLTLACLLIKSGGANIHSFHHEVWTSLSLNIEDVYLLVLSFAGNRFELCKIDGAFLLFCFFLAIIQYSV
jgi:hypothetical protein